MVKRDAAVGRRLTLGPLAHGVWWEAAALSPRGYRAPVPYPPRPQLRPLTEFAGTADPRPDPAVQARVEVFIVEQYLAGRSLRELSELTDRSFSAVRNILAKRDIHRRGAGAARLCQPKG